MTDCIKCGEELRYLPEDQIANYICMGCGFMATKEWFDNLTLEQINDIQEKEAETKRFWQKHAGKREADRIKQKLNEIEQKDEVAELLQKHKKVVPLDKFTG